MKHYVMELRINWADEIDFESATIVTEEEKKKFDDAIAEGGSLSIYFGTNEDGDYDLSEINRCTRFTEIPEKHVSIIEPHLSSSLADEVYSNVVDERE